MSDPAPLEVSLVEKVKACRTCVWFWKGTPPYGPYPGFDWNTDFPPEALRNEKQPAGYVPAQPWLSAKLVGPTFSDPGIMHGCRKAPIMTIGINPNLTAWFPYTSSTPWIYPAFTAPQRYAYYYRHFTLYQESLSLDFVRAHLDPGQRLVAEDDGYVIAASRESSHNYLQLAVRYRGRGEDKVYEITWKPDERWVVVQNTGYADKPDSWFKKGDTLAGRFDAPSGASAEIYENAAGYYQRMVPVLDRFKKLTGLDAANLTIGEDVAQHDMVACASPGWQTKFDMPMDKIAANCVSDHGWMVAQFVQSQPALVILVSTSALAMFRSVFAPFMTLQNPDRDVYQLLDETCRHRGRDRDNQCVGANFGSDLLQHFRNGLRFYCQQNDVSAFDRFAIVGGHCNAELLRERGYSLRMLYSRDDPIGHKQSLFQKCPQQDATQFAGTEYRQFFVGKFR